MGGMGTAGVVAAIIALADIHRQKNGQIEDDYDRRRPTAMARAAPVLGGPAAIYTGLTGDRDSALAKVLQIGPKGEEEVVGEPLDEIFNIDTIQKKGIGQALDNSWDKFYRATLGRFL